MQRLTRWGNSTGIRISAAILEAANLGPGDYCQVRLLDSGDIRVRPIRQRIPADPCPAEAVPLTPEEVDKKKW
jgi:antitoxin MazE